MNTTVAPGDVLVLAQEVEPPIVNGISIQCANVTMRVLGETREYERDESGCMIVQVHICVQMFFYRGSC